MVRKAHNQMRFKSASRVTARGLAILPVVRFFIYDATVKTNPVYPNGVFCGGKNE